MVDLRANPAAMAPTAPVGAPTRAPTGAPAGPSTVQRLQELETLRAAGAITDAESTAKRQQIIEAP